MNRTVKFEIAKLLKEKGFDESTYSFFFDDVPNSPITKNERIQYNKIYKSISAPTISEVVMWLYEKHEIWINVDISGTFAKNTIEGEFYYKVIKNNKEVQPGFLMQDFFNSPTEAYEAAIEYTLNNLI